VITVDCDAGDKIRLNDTLLDLGDSIDSPGGIGNYIVLIAWTADLWITWGRSGVWIDGGP